MARNPWWAPWALSNLIEPSLRSLSVQIPDIAEMKAGERTLDVCCGTGGLALIYAEVGIAAAGIDIDHRVIEVANKKAERRNLPDVSFQTASALELPFKNNSFDHASITMGIHEIKRHHRDAILSEMKRVVKSQGTLVFLDYIAPLPHGPYSWLAKVTEFLAGNEHNSCFKGFLMQGGLTALLKQHHLLGERKRELSLVEIVVAKNEESLGNPDLYISL